MAWTAAEAVCLTVSCLDLLHPSAPLCSCMVSITPSLLQVLQRFPAVPREAGCPGLAHLVPQPPERFLSFILLPQSQSLPFSHWTSLDGCSSSVLSSTISFPSPSTYPALFIHSQIGHLQGVLYTPHWVRSPHIFSWPIMNSL